MLYDQAQLANSFLDLYLLTGDQEAQEGVHDILSYVSECLISPGSIFYFFITLQMVFIQQKMLILLTQTQARKKKEHFMSGPMQVFK